MCHVIYMCDFEFIMFVVFFFYLNGWGCFFVAMCVICLEAC